jgi:hypothetical protein
LIIPSPEFNPFFKAKALRKKILPERSEVWRFFSANPAGVCLDGKGIVHNFVSKKVGGNSK